jgi:hypothetical protein
VGSENKRERETNDEQKKNKRKNDEQKYTLDATTHFVDRELDGVLLPLPNNEHLRARVHPLLVFHRTRLERDHARDEARLVERSARLRKTLRPGGAEGRRLEIAQREFRLAAHHLCEDRGGRREERRREEGGGRRGGGGG